MELEQGRLDEIAALSRLSVLPEARAEWSDALSRVLDYMEVLTAMEGTDTPEEAFGGVLRADEVTPSLRCEETLSNAPWTDGETFWVPPTW